MGQFNTDTAALKTRADLNASNATHNLEDWILTQIPDLKGKRVLDLGCGTGKQLFAFADKAASLVGVDASQDAVDAVNARGVVNVFAKQIQLDDVPSELAMMRFDVILSTYAFYYSRDQVQLLKDLRPLLNEGGCVFIAGPAQGSNQELIAIVNKCLSDAEQLADVENSLSVQEIDDAVGGYAIYSSFVETLLENQVAFDSAESLMAWWRNHNTYRENAAACVESLVREHFAGNSQFIVTKNVQGVRFNA